MDDSIGVNRSFRGIRHAFCFKGHLGSNMNGLFRLEEVRSVKALTVTHAPNRGLGSDSTPINQSFLTPIGRSPQVNALSSCKSEMYVAFQSTNATIAPFSWNWSLIRPSRGPKNAPTPLIHSQPIRAPNMRQPIRAPTRPSWPN